MQVLVEYPRTNFNFPCIPMERLMCPRQTFYLAELLNQACIVLPGETVLGFSR